MIFCALYSDPERVPYGLCASNNSPLQPSYTCPCLCTRLCIPVSVNGSTLLTYITSVNPCKDMDGKVLDPFNDEHGR